MTDVIMLEEKIIQLEERLKKLEAVVSTMPGSDERHYMNVLLAKSKELIQKHKEASILFLQKKLMIDFRRAEQLMRELERDGIISPAVPGEARKVL